MTENNAAQILDAIRAAGYRDHPTNIERKRVDAILLAVEPLLSKLRAEGVQAGDERAAFNKWADSLGYELGTPTVGLMLAGWNARAALASAPVAKERDVTSILLEIVPGEDGMGHEIYAKSVEDVENALSKMGGELEEWQLGMRRLASAPVADEQQWRIRVVGPAGHERFETFNGSSLDDACAAAMRQGFICCQDEDGHVIVEDSPARTVQVQNSAPVAGEAVAWLSDAGLESLRRFGQASVVGPGARSESSEFKHPLYAAPQASEAVRMNDAMREFIEGMEVSVDVSTGDDDAGHRLFGTIAEVMDSPGSKHGVILLMHDQEPNFETQADKDGGDCAKGAGDHMSQDLDRDIPGSFKAFSNWVMNQPNDQIYVHSAQEGFLAGVEWCRQQHAALSPTPSVVKQSLTATQTGEKGESDDDR